MNTVCDIIPYGEEIFGMENFKKKAENFWYYYKRYVLIGIVVVVFLTVEIVSALNKVKPDIIVAYIGESYFDTEKAKPFTDKLASYIGDVNGDKKEKALFVDNTIGGDANQVLYLKQKAETLFLSGQNSLFLIEGKFAEAYALSQANFLPLEGAKEGLSNENGIYAVKVDMSEYGYMGNDLYCLVYDAGEDNEKWESVLSAAKKGAEYMISQQ